MTDTLKYAFIGNLTKSRDDKGFLHIKGLASDDTLDLDGQICDPEWLAGAMSQWFKTGNIREMHGMSAVGKATAMNQDGTGFGIEAKIVDPLAATKTEEGVYGGLSIGIKGARVDTSKSARERAPEGVIVGGRIVEVSLVDLPANPSAVLELVKTVGDVTEKTEALGEVEDLDKADAYKPAPYKADTDETVECPKCHRMNDRDAHFCDQCGFKLDGATDVEVKTVEGDVEKAEMSAKEMNDMPDSDFAYVEPGGTKDEDGKTVPRSNRHFPIHDKAHVRNALARAPQSPFGSKAMPKIRAAAKKFGIDVSKSGVTDFLKAADTHDPAQLADVRSNLISVIEAELEEMKSGEESEVSDVYELLQALSLFINWWSDEADNGETAEPFKEEDDMNYVALGVSPDTVKAATAADATDEAKTALRDELRKGLGLEEIATKTEVEELREANKSLEAELSVIREMAAPGQPALRATQELSAKAAQADDLEIKAARYRANAYAQTDQATAQQYMDAAMTADREAAKIRAGLS
jgi:hypothetical protein